jgi:hypothetical protein
MDERVAVLDLPVCAIIPLYQERSMEREEDMIVNGELAKTTI